LIGKASVTPSATPQAKTPGFEIVIAIVSLLVVACGESRYDKKGKKEEEKK